MNSSQAIVDFAVSKLGAEEYSGNQGFKDPIFDMQMRRVGFENGWAWCALFAEACWAVPTYSNKSKVVASISDNFSANAVRTYENFEKDDTGYFSVSEEDAHPGSVVIWEKVRDGEPVKKGIWTLGHAGIVESVNPGGIVTIEGNTNDSGGREGIEVARKQSIRRNALPAVDIQNGLRLKGFITMNV